MFLSLDTTTGSRYLISCIATVFLLLVGKDAEILGDGSRMQGNAKAIRRSPDCEGIFIARIAQKLAATRS
jgi:hypothetical protein